jgi:hypothetical protein
MSYQIVVDQATHNQVYQTQEFWSQMILLALGAIFVFLSFAGVLFERFALKHSIATQCLKRGKIPRGHSWRNDACMRGPSRLWIATHKLRLLLRWDKPKRAIRRQVLRSVDA